MVKTKKNIKKGKVAEGTTDVDPKVEDATDNQAEDEGTQNEDTSAKKRGKAKKEEPASQEEVEDSEETNAKENGEVAAENKKPAAEKKGKATKRAAAKPTTEPARKSSRTPKPVVTKQNGEEESYEVERLVDSRQYRGKTQFLVRWKGYTKSDDTWEDESDLNCPELLQKFKEDNPNAQNKAKKRSASKSPVKTEAKKAKTKSPKNDYEVEEVVGMRVKNGKKEFKIRWKGYKANEDTWEPEKHLSCQDLIQAYLDDHKDEVEDATKKTPLKKARTPTKAAKGKKAKRK